MFDPQLPDAAVVAAISEGARAEAADATNSGTATTYDIAAPSRVG